MAGIDSGCSAGGNSAASSGIGRLTGGAQFGFPYGLGWAGGGNAFRQGSGRWQDRRALVFQIQLIDLGLDLRFEFVRGAFKFAQSPTDLPADFRQLLWPKDEQGQNKQEHHFGEAQIHRLMILPERIAANPARG